MPSHWGQVYQREELEHQVANRIYLMTSAQWLEDWINYRNRLI